MLQVKLSNLLKDKKFELLRSNHRHQWAQLTDCVPAKAGFLAAFDDGSYIHLATPYVFFDPALVSLAVLDINKRSIKVEVFYDTGTYSKTVDMDFIVGAVPPDHGESVGNTESAALLRTQDNTVMAEAETELKAQYLKIMTNAGISTLAATAINALLFDISSATETSNFKLTNLTIEPKQDDRIVVARLTDETSPIKVLSVVFGASTQRWDPVHRIVDNTPISSIELKNGDVVQIFSTPHTFTALVSSDNRK